MQSEITFFAKTNYRNQEIPFGIKTDDRRRHMYVIGKTGMGKTTLMENMAIQDIQSGRGVCYIDPHGDSVLKILNFIPNDRVNDVVYFNPADLEYPIAFNILESVDNNASKHLVASGLMSVFTKIWANVWSSRMEYILNHTILALLDSPGNTMLGILRMYADKEYRKKIIDNVKDPIVRSFWVDEYANWQEKFRSEAVAPIQNKVGQFLSSGIVRNIVGQPKSTIDLRKIMDEKKILLLDLSKGRVGENNAALLGAMIITRLQLAAMSRADVPEEQREDFYLYVDEFQNFVTDSFATILSEARKYRLNLTIGHQYIGQLTPDRANTAVRDAVFGNVGTMVTFRVGSADAEYLKTEFEPQFAPTDIVNLPKASVILRLMINGIASEPFTAQTLPPINRQFTGNKDKVIKVSRERYANEIEGVQEKINRWMGAEFHSGVQADARGGIGHESAAHTNRNDPNALDMLQSSPESSAANFQSSSIRSQQSSKPKGGLGLSSTALEKVQSRKPAPQDQIQQRSSTMPFQRPTRPQTQSGYNKNSGYSNQSVRQQNPAPVESRFNRGKPLSEEQKTGLVQSSFQKPPVNQKSYSSESTVHYINQFPKKQSTTSSESQQSNSVHSNTESFEEVLKSALLESLQSSKTKNSGKSQ